MQGQENLRGRRRDGPEHGQSGGRGRGRRCRRRQATPRRLRPISAQYSPHGAGPHVRVEEYQRGHTGLFSIILILIIIICIRFVRNARMAYCT